jgi:hypothetical protein
MLRIIDNSLKIYFFFVKESIAITRKAIPARLLSPVKNNTTPATINAGIKNIKAPTMKIIIDPIKTRIISPQKRSRPTVTCPNEFKAIPWKFIRIYLKI